MRRSTLLTFLLIVVLTAVAVWIAVPGSRTIAGRQVQVVEGLDLQGGLQVLLKANPSKGQQVTDQAMNDVRTVIENRVNGLGVTEPLVQRQGKDQLVVEIPGIKDPNQAIKTLQGTGLLEIIGTGTTSLPVGTTVRTTLGSAPPGNNAPPTQTVTTSTTPSLVKGSTASATPGATTTALPGNQPASGGTSTGNTSTGQGQIYQTVITGNDIAKASPAFDQTTNQPIVTFTLKGEGKSKFGQYTTNHVGQYLSVVLDKKVINSAVIQSPITQGTGQIDGLSQPEAQSLALQLRYGALPIAMKVISSNSVGATLGQDSVQRSIIAGAIGILAVALFMILYYRLPGLLAAIALGVYGSLVFAVFKIIPVTLTLAGIAGFILSIGMAVDANVLIFSRMKEELRRGRGLLQAVDLGFRNAWPSIRDSNVSTLITCAILYWFGSQYGASIIKGFALTLGIGVLVSMFSAIIVTRTFLQFVVATPVVKNIWLWGVSRSDVPPRPAAGTTLGGTRAQ